MNKELFEKICRHEGNVVFLPSSDEEIKNTNSFLSTQSFAEIPADYQNFLKLSNGIIFNGIELMGTLPQQRIEKKYIFPDLIQINKPYSKYEYFNSKLVLGRLSESIICYDGTNATYALIDRINLRSRFESKSFREMFFYILKIGDIELK